MTSFSSLTVGLGNLETFSSKENSAKNYLEASTVWLGVGAKSKAGVVGFMAGPGRQRHLESGDPAPGARPRQRYFAARGGVGNGGNLQVIGLAFDATPFLVAWQNNITGYWYSPGSLRLSGVNARYSQLATGPGNGLPVTGDAVPGETIYQNTLQLIGLGANDGLAYLAAWQDNSGNWTSKDLLLAYGNKYSQLVTGVGNNNYLQIIGLGLDGFAYLAAWQDNGGFWHATTSNGADFQLPGQTAPLSQIYAGRGASALQVIGLSQIGGLPYLAGWQDGSGSWHPGRPLDGPGGGIAFSQLAVGYSGLSNGDVLTAADAPLQLIGLGAENGFAYSAAFLDSQGVWHPGIELPSQFIRFTQLVAGASVPPGNLQVIGLTQTGEPWKAAWLDGNNVWQPGGKISSAG